MARRPDDDEFGDLKNIDIDDIFENDVDDLDTEETSLDPKEKKIAEDMVKYLYDEDEGADDDGESDEDESGFVDNSFELKFDDTVETTIEDSTVNDSDEDEESGNETDDNDESVEESKSDEESESVEESKSDEESESVEEVNTEPEIESKPEEKNEVEENPDEKESIEEYRKTLAAKIERENKMTGKHMFLLSNGSTEPGFNPDGTVNENADPMLIIDDPEEYENENSNDESSEKAEKDTEIEPIVSEKEVDENIEESKTETEPETKSEIESEIKPNCDEFNHVLDEEISKSKKYDYCSKDDDKISIDMLADDFRNMLKHFYAKYTEDDLVNYINDFVAKNDEEKRIFNDIFVMQYCKYSFAINFNNELAEQNLWVLAAGLFADHIEEMKYSGKINSEVISDGPSFNQNNIIEDHDIATTREYQKAQEEKYSQYKLDRTVFNISEIDDEESSSIFDDKRTLHREFYESEFYSIHKEVLTSDRFADMSSIRSEVIINEATSFIPIIDYSTGIRVVCIDTSDTDQYRLNPLIISRKVKFSFKNMSMRDVKVRVLYLDDAKYRPMAVICALKKLI